MPSFKIVDLAIAMGAQPPWELIGLRGIEKLHEDLVGEHETRVVGAPVPTRSDTNKWWLDVDDLRGMV